MKKSLFIVENSSLGNELKSIINKNKLNFDFEICMVNNFIVNTDQFFLSSEKLSEEEYYNLLKNCNKIVLKIEQENIFDLNLSKITDTSNFKRIYIKERDNSRSNIILETLKNNNFDCIINACDPDVSGQLMFEYMIESLNISNVELKRFWINDLTESKMLDALLNLKDNDEISNCLLKIA